MTESIDPTKQPDFNVPLKGNEPFDENNPDDDIREGKIKHFTNVEELLRSLANPW